jgi:hypothetical protein
VCQDPARWEESDKLTLTLEGSELPYEEEGESEEIADSTVGRQAHDGRRKATADRLCGRSSLWRFTRSLQDDDNPERKGEGEHTETTSKTARTVTYVEMISARSCLLLGHVLTLLRTLLADSTVGRQAHDGRRKATASHSLQDDDNPERKGEGEHTETTSKTARTVTYVEMERELARSRLQKPARAAYVLGTKPCYFSPCRPD